MQVLGEKLCACDEAATRYNDRRGVRGRPASPAPPSCVPSSSAADACARCAVSIGLVAVGMERYGFNLSLKKYGNGEARGSRSLTAT